MATLRKDKQEKQKRRRARIGAPDERLSPAAGVEVVREVEAVLGITTALDEHIGPVKARARGISSGQLLMSMACAQLAGAQYLVGLDRRRAETAGQVLEPVPIPAATTAAGIAPTAGCGPRRRPRPAPPRGGR